MCAQLQGTSDGTCSPVRIPRQQTLPFVCAHLQGTSDLTLVEFLLNLTSNGEVAEYVQLYLGSTPAAASFTAEFMRRKFEQGSGKKSKRSKAKQAAPGVCVCVVCVCVGGGGVQQTNIVCSVILS